MEKERWNLYIGKNLKMPKELTTHRRLTPFKDRSPSVYNNKVKKITDWYNHLLKEREKDEVINPNTKDYPKRKELKSLDFYIEKITKSRG